MTLQEGKRAIACAVSDHGVKARGPGHPQVNLPAQLPFRFNTSRASPPGDRSAHARFPKIDRPLVGLLEAAGCNRRRRDRRPQSPRFPSPLPDRGFESDRSSDLHGIFQVILVGLFRWFWAFATRQEMMGGNSYEDKPTYF